MSKFYFLSEDTIDTFMKVYNKKAFSISVNFEFVGSETQKSLIKITKLADQFAFILSKDVLVSINEDLMNVFDEESVQILIEQEIDKITTNIETGKIRLVKPDLTTFSGLINKYGIEKIAKANKVEELFAQQKQDQEEGFII
jgi:hypothetical protein